MKIKLLLLSFLITCFAYSQTISVSGTIASNTTWAADTVKVIGDIQVNSNITLTINPHTYVEFQGYYQFLVCGRMLALGTVTDSITFTINDTTGFSSTGNQGGWNKLLFSVTPSLNDTSNFQYCKFTYCKSVAIFCIGNDIVIEHCAFYNNGSAFYSYPMHSVKISHNLIRNNQNSVVVNQVASSLVSFNVIQNNKYGLFVTKSFCEISNNIISNNATWGLQVVSEKQGSTINNNQITYNGFSGLSIQNDTNSIINNNTINYNFSPNGAGAGIYVLNSYSKIINNTISSNTSGGGAGIYLVNHSSPLIFSNKITNNHATGSGCGIADDGAGIFSIGHSTPVIINNLICNNETENNGGGIACLDSSFITLINNTIVNNKANNNLGGGGLSIGFGYSSAYLKNNIVWSNSSPSSSPDIFATNIGIPFDIDYCNFQDTINTPFGSGYTTNYHHLLMANPLFVNPSAGAGIAYEGLAADWSLQQNSPCINAGSPDTTYFHLFSTDIAGNPRVQFNTIDIGAYESNSDITTSIINSAIHNSIITYPNPARENINIIFNNIGASQLLLTITNALAETVYTETITPTSSYIFKAVDVSKLSAGIYSITFHDDKEMLYSKRIVKE